MAASGSTKEKIVNGFISLLNQKNFSEIKTVDIIKESNVSHQTFYRLYADKYELAESVCFDMFYRFQSVYGENATWKDLTLSLLYIIKNNSRFFKHLTSNVEGEKIFRNSLKKLSFSLTGAVGTPPVYYTWTCILDEWIDDKFTTPVNDMYKKLCSYLPISDILSGKDLEQTLTRYEQLDISYYIKKAQTKSQ